MTPSPIRSLTKRKGAGSVLVESARLARRLEAAHVLSRKSGTFPDTPTGRKNVGAGCSRTHLAASRRCMGGPARACRSSFILVVVPLVVESPSHPELDCLAICEFGEIGYVLSG